MAKFVFLNIPGAGHVNVTLGVVQELVRRGQEVTYFLPEEYRSVIEATGASFQPYVLKRRDAQAGFPLKSHDEAAIAYFKLLHIVPDGIVEQIRLEKPDVIVYGYLCIWAREVSKQFDALRVATRPTYASNKHFNVIEELKTSDWSGVLSGGYDMLERMYREMEEQGGVQDNPLATLFSAFRYAEMLNIVFVARAFQPAVETFDERYLFVGPSISPRHEASDFPFERIDPERPLLYISLGSLFTDQPDFYKCCFAAFADQPWQVVLSIGKLIDVRTLGSVPENFLLSPYVPQLDILPRARLFITHCGTNSVMESMYFGVPMVLYPQQPEQLMTAQRVAGLNLGIVLKKGHISAEILRSAVEEVASNEAYYDRARQMQQFVRADGGYQRATDALMQLVTKPY